MTVTSSSRRRSGADRGEGGRPGWLAWPLIVKERFPNMALDRPQFSLFVKAYLTKNKLDEVKVSVPGMPTKCYAVPDSMCDGFMEAFMDKFKYIDEIKAVLGGGVDTGVARTDSMASTLHAVSGLGEKRGLDVEDDAEETAKKMQRRDAKHAAINKSGVLLYNK